MEKKEKIRFPYVIVLILSYNGKDLLFDSVSTYLQNDYPNFKVFVIDNGSIDGTQDYMKLNFPDVTCLRLEKNRGYSGGFNFGLDHAFNQEKADYVLITNNDVKADKAVISSLVNVAESDNSIGFVTGKVYFFDQPDILQTVGKTEDPIRWMGSHIGNREKDTGQFDEITERVFCDDIFWLVRREMYLKTGGYNTIFFLEAEDYDWQARGKKIGYKIFYTPYAKIWHKDSMTIGKISPLKAYHAVRNPMLVVLIHKSPAFFRRFFWHHFYRFVLKASLRSLILKKDFKMANSILKGFFSGLKYGINNRLLTFQHFI